MPVTLCLVCLSRRVGRLVALNTLTIKPGVNFPAGFHTWFCPACRSSGERDYA